MTEPTGVDLTTREESAPAEAPDILAEQDADEAAFLESLGIAPPETDDRTEVDVYLDALIEAIADARATIEANEEIAERRMDVIRRWRDDENGPLARRVAYLKRQVEAHARRYDFGKKKSRNLPHGTFGFRSGRDTVHIEDMGAAVRFAEANGIETKTRVNKSPLLAHLKETGELPDGCAFVEAEERFYVKTGG